MNTCPFFLDYKQLIPIALISNHMNYAIIVAGGSGSRMKSDKPKQFLLLNGMPVLMHTIKAFYNSSAKPNILLVLNTTFHDYWAGLCREHSFDIPHQIIAGGNERFNSVKNALNTIAQDGLIAVHDAVRPVVSDELITRCFVDASKHGATIPVTSSRDSLRKKEGGTTRAINRDDILIVQTPQVFKSEILRKAYNQEFTPEFTDDASVVEKAGFSISLVEGDFKNIKITYPEDLQMASIFLR